MRNSHEPFIEPAHDVLKTLYAMPWLAGTGELMSLAWKDNHGGWPFQKLERAEQLFTARILGSAVVGFAQHKQDGAVNILHSVMAERLA